MCNIASTKIMFLSIIVPVYNVDKYINKCLDSLLNQTINDYELVVINDGSSDRTNDIIEHDYVNKVIYINKDNNTGLSDTRNLGMQFANGEYIIFVDGDDYVERDCVEKIREEIKKNPQIDVLYTGHYKEKKEICVKYKGFASESNKIWKVDDFLISELGKRKFPVPACFAVYRKDFLIKNKLKFTTGIYHEDELWSAEVALKAKKIRTSDICYYHYVIRQGSITQKKDLTQNGLDVIFICNIMIEMLKEIENPLVNRLFANHIAMLYMKGMCRGKLYRKEYRNKFDRKIPIKYAYFLKDKLKAALFAISPCLYCKIDSRYGTKL